MRITIVTDAWLPQVNGVVRTMMRMVDELGSRGHELQVISPDLFCSVPCPTYAEIRLALLPRRRLQNKRRIRSAETPCRQEIPPPPEVCEPAPD